MMCGFSILNVILCLTQCAQIITKKGNFEWEIYLTKQKQVAISNGTEK